MNRQSVIFEGNTEYGHYHVVDTIYSGRPARVLYSGHFQAAQSGLAQDDNADLLFDYNQRFIELVRGLSPKRLLLIGGGAFTLPKAMLTEFPSLKLDIVELDAGLIHIATTYFDFKPTDQTHIHVVDGRRYLDENHGLYDVILIDAFTHTTIPQSLQTIEAAQSMINNLRPHGVVAMNIIAAYYGERSAVLKRQIGAVQTAFMDVELFPASRSESLWMPQNFILTAQNDRRDLQQYIRHQQLVLPKVTEADKAIDV